MASTGRIQTLLTCAKAQERHAMLPDRFSVGYFRLGTRLVHELFPTCSHILVMAYHFVQMSRSRGLSLQLFCLSTMPDSWRLYPLDYRH